MMEACANAFDFFISDYNMSDKPQKINPSQPKCVTCRYLGCLCVPKHCLRACDFLQVCCHHPKLPPTQLSSVKLMTVVVVTVGLVAVWDKDSWGKDR